MANEIKLTYTAGKTTITADVFSADGATQRGSDIALSDSGHAGLYLGDLATIRTGDIILFYEGTVYLTGQTYQEIGWSITGAEGADVLVISICNQALGLLGAEEISANETSERNYILCDRFYSGARDEILAAHKWNFAKKRSLAIQTTDPLFGYDNAFTKPSDCVKLWQIEQDPLAKFEVEGDLILTDKGETPPGWVTATDYLAGQYISSDDSGSDLTYLVDTAFTSSTESSDLSSYCTSQGDDYQYIEIEYVYQQTAVASWPSYMQRCVVLDLALKLAAPIKQDEKVALNLQQMLYGSPKVIGQLDIARSIDAQEGGAITIKTSTWLDARK